MPLDCGQTLNALLTADGGKCQATSLSRADEPVPGVLMNDSDAALARDDDGLPHAPPTLNSAAVYEGELLVPSAEPRTSR